MSKIVQVEVGRYDYPVHGSFAKFLKPGPDGRVVRPTILVRLTDDEGDQGWGQAVPVPTWAYETPETVESTIRHYLGRALLGLDPADIAEVHRQMNQAVRPALSTGQPLCKAAVDAACHDLVARKRGVPVRDLVPGSRRDEILLSWTVAAPTLAEAEEQLEEGLARGYRHFNIKVGPPQSLEYDLNLAKRVREFSPDGFLWADANTGYDLETALAAAPKLADLGVGALESPLPPLNIRGYQALKRQGALPIIMDEGIISPVETREFVALGMLDGVAMKLGRSAGFASAQEIVRILREEGLMVLGSGLTDPDLSLAATAHFFCWADIEYPCALNGPQFLQPAPFFAALPIAGDTLRLPAGPGLGLTPSQEVEPLMSVAATL